MLLNQKLVAFKQGFYQFSIDDSLVDLKTHKAVSIKDSTSFSKSFLKSILKDALFFEKEFGINSLCTVKGIVKLNYRDKIVTTPILLKNCSFSEDKIQQTIQLLETEEEFELNPFLRFYLSHFFDLSVEENDQTFLTFLQTKFSNEIDEKELFIGNFHPHRHRFLYELEAILVAEKHALPLQHIFGDLTQDYPIDHLTKNTIFPTDEDQQKAFETLENESIILQGPPGTGKSQTITNTIYKFLESHKTVLVVSEKKAALEIIYAKLKERNLDLLSLFPNSSNNPNEIYTNLKETWIQFENVATTSIENQTSSIAFETLTKYIDAFQNPKIVGGISLINFLEESKTIDFNIQRPYLNNPPSITAFKQAEKTIEQLSAADFKLLMGLKFEFIVASYETIISNLTSNFETIQKLKKTFQIKELSELETLIKQALTYQNFSSNIYKKYGALLTKNTKKFFALRKKWNHLSNQLSVLKNHENHWLQFPSIDEIKVLRKQANSDKILDKIRWKNRWKKWTRSPELNAIDQLNTYQKSVELQLEIASIKNQFLELDVSNTDEIETIYLLIQSTNLDEWKSFQQTNEKHLKEILNSHSLLKNLQNELYQFLNFEAETEIDKSLENTLSSIDRLLHLKSELSTVSKSIFESLKLAVHFHDWKNLIYTANWKQFVANNPVFQNFNVKEVYLLAKKINFINNEEIPKITNQLLGKQVQKFRDFHQLINTPNSKLTVAQKSKKQRLKIGKSILVKEFSKQRNHLSLRQLIASEAQLWIAVLKPIWLTNPTKLAITFPMTCELFDLVIFDEAGRIPLVHALGALQRSKKVLVAGDPQQMGPSNYFGENTVGEEDLLHQATFYLKNIFLSNHYRSKNAALIAFSNVHFYNNQLKVYPEFSALKQHPIRFHFVKNGIYSAGQNELEAPQVALEIEKKISCSEKIGIVAFSETQLNLIFSKLRIETQERLLERISVDSAFFKTLEQVQGDECDNLIISFGYGKNTDGKFEMRFGPLNQQNGKKRLNVLFTRARSNIDFFASVQASDFPISDNEAIRLLWLWFCFVDTKQTSKEPQISSNQLDFQEVISTTKNTIELCNKIAILEERGWKFSF
jgi:hypothetical protein